MFSNSLVYLRYPHRIIRPMEDTQASGKAENKTGYPLALNVQYLSLGTWMSFSMFDQKCLLGTQVLLLLMLVTCTNIISGTSK